MRQACSLAITGTVPVAIGPVRVAAASDLANMPSPSRNLLREPVFQAWRQAGAESPLIAFVHCGREYDSQPAARVRELADWAENAGAALFLGCHPHRPSERWERGKKSLRYYSMGNLIFDQLDPLNTGGLIEVRFFGQGTWSTRWIPLGNLYLDSTRSR